MRDDMKKSLKEEIEKQAARLEASVLSNPELEHVEVTDEMEEALAAKIKQYEEERSKSTLSEEDREALRIGREVKAQRQKEQKRRMPRNRKVLVALVAVMVLVLGLGVTSVGSSSYWKMLFDRMLGNEITKTMNVEDMDVRELEDGDEIAAYREIEKCFGSNVVRLRYMPKGMGLSETAIDEEQRLARLFYQLGEEQIRYTIYSGTIVSSRNQKTEDKLKDTFQVETEKQLVEVKEYEVKNKSDFRYLAEFEYRGMQYQLKGIMDRAEFEKIIKNLQFI